MLMNFYGNKKRKSNSRGPVKMGFITDKQKRKVTFCKRSKTLLKSLFILCARQFFSGML